MRSLALPSALIRIGGCILLGLLAGACGPSAQEIAQQNRLALERQQRLAMERQERQNRLALEALEQEIQRSNAERSAQMAARDTVGEVSREVEWQSRVRAAFQRYGFRPDAFQEAVWAYRVAVMERLEKGEITKAQARALIAEYGSRVLMAREQLRAAQNEQNLHTLQLGLQMLQMSQATSASQAAQAAAVWSQFSQSMNAINQAMQQYYLQQQLQQQQLRPMTPIRCETQYLGRMASTTCY